MMGITNLVGGSIAVLVLVTCSIVTGWNPQPTALRSNSLTRQTSVTVHHSNWNLFPLGDEAATVGGFRYLNWKETLDVPIRTIPICPTTSPGLVRSLGIAVSHVVQRISTSAPNSCPQSLIDVSSHIAARERELGAWRRSDVVDSRFCVVSTAIWNAQQALEHPIGTEPRDQRKPVRIDTEAFKRQMANHTEVIFADFEITRQRSNNNDATPIAYRFRLWYENATSEWHIVRLAAEEVQNAPPEKPWWHQHNLLGLR
jgi:hypothetical protein